MDCANCGNKLDSGKLRCNECGQWTHHDAQPKASKLLSKVETSKLHRVPTGPWDTVFGGGLVCTSVVLIGGGPGAGKSTMGLQIADEIVDLLDEEVIYIHAEQSEAEVKLTADRLGIRHLNKIRVREKVTIGAMWGAFKAHEPAAVILDSVTALTGGDKYESLEACKELKRCANGLYAPVIVINQVAKKDDFAGLMALQHEVDGLFTLKVDRRSGLRVFRAHKHRFGPAPLEMFLEMTPTGLVEVKRDDPEEEEEGAAPPLESPPTPKGQSKKRGRRKKESG